MDSQCDQEVIDAFKKKKSCKSGDDANKSGFQTPTIPGQKKASKNGSESPAPSAGGFAAGSA